MFSCYSKNSTDRFTGFNLIKGINLKITHNIIPFPLTFMTSIIKNNTVQKNALLLLVIYD